MVKSVPRMTAVDTHAGMRTTDCGVLRSPAGDGTPGLVMVDGPHSGEPKPGPPAGERRRPRREHADAPSGWSSATTGSRRRAVRQPIERRGAEFGGQAPANQATGARTMTSRVRTRRAVWSVGHRSNPSKRAARRAEYGPIRRLGVVVLPPRAVAQRSEEH